MICGCIGIVAEVSYEALKKRHDQGWVSEIIDDLDKLMARVIKARAGKEGSILYSDVDYSRMSRVSVLDKYSCILHRQPVSDIMAMWWTSGRDLCSIW